MPVPYFTVTMETAAEIGNAVLSDVNFLVPDPAQLALITVGEYIEIAVQGAETVLCGVIAEVDPTSPGGPLVTVVI